MRLGITLIFVVMVSCSQAEPDDGYYGNKYEYEYDGDGKCDLVQGLGYKESYEIYSFPPEDARRGGCTWEFVAADDGCTLEFYTRDFQKGYNNCEHEVLTIGDETKKRRICEFGEPPRHFTSSGRKLYLNFSRTYENWYRRPVRPSRLSGVVICAPTRRSRPQYGSGAYYNNVPTTVAPTTAAPSTAAPTTAAPTTAAPTTAAPTTTKPPCLQSDLFDAPGNNSVSFSGAYGLALPGDNPVGAAVAPLMIELALACPDQVRGCAARVTACYGNVAATRATLTAALASPASESVEPVHSSLSNVAGTRCVTKSGMCKGTGPCSGPAEFGPDHGGRGAARIQIFPDCDATAEQICKFTVTLCVQPIK